MFSKPTRPLFIVIEGIDCSGKTTLINFLKQKINDDKEFSGMFDNMLFTHEPGGLNLPFDQEIRKLLLYEKHDISEITAALLFFASQSENLRKAILPTLQQNGLVVCDRFFLSTLVYQGCFGKIDFEFLHTLIMQISKKTEPNIIFKLNITEETYNERMKAKHDSKQSNLYDESHEYSEMMKAYDKSIAFLKLHKQNIVDLDGNKSLEENAKIIMEKIKNWK